MMNKLPLQPVLHPERKSLDKEKSSQSMQKLSALSKQLDPIADVPIGVSHREFEGDDSVMPN